MSGFFLVVEGPEGAGKSTLVRELERRLIDAGHRVQMVHEPGGTIFGMHLREVVLDPAHRIPPAGELFVMLAARAALIAEVIRPQLDQGFVVLSDRFDLSTIAYQVAGRGLPLGSVAAANALATGGLVPDLTLVLDIPREVGEARQAQAGKPLDRLERESDDFHRRVHEAYRAASGPGIVHLDAARSAPAVADAAWSEIQRRLRR